MLKFSEDIADILNEMDTLLVKINIIIDGNSDFDELVNERISKIYKERQIYFHKLEDWLVSPDGKDFVAQNNTEWDAIMLRMQNNDKLTMEKISGKLDSLKKKLANINQNKSLFIYSKK